MKLTDHKHWPQLPISCGNDRQYSIDQIYNYHTPEKGRSLILSYNFGHGYGYYMVANISGNTTTTPSKVLSLEDIYSGLNIDDFRIMVYGQITVQLVYCLPDIGPCRFLRFIGP